MRLDIALCLVVVIVTSLIDNIFVTMFIAGPIVSMLTIMRWVKKENISKDMLSQLSFFVLLWICGDIVSLTYKNILSFSEFNDQLMIFFAGSVLFMLANKGLSFLVTNKKFIFLKNEYERSQNN